MKKFIATLTFFLAAMAVYAPPSSAQSVSESLSITISNSSPGAVTSPVRNVGQSAHQFYGCLSLGSAVASGNVQIELEASSDDVNYTAVSPLITLSNATTESSTMVPCATLSANGYYASIRVAAFNGSFAGGAGNGTVAGVYTGSNGVSPVGGEARTASDATKVSPVATQPSFIGTALKSTSTHVITAPALPSTISTFINGVIVSNPNASTTVYVQLGPNSTTSTSPDVLVPVSGGVSVAVLFPSPIYAPGDLYVACSTSPTSEVDPATGCFVEVLSTTRYGSNSRVNAGGTVLNSDGSIGSIPH